MIFWMKLILYALYFIMLYLSVFFVISFLIERKKLLTDIKKRKLLIYPQVSVVVPAYNEEEGIIKTARSLFKLKYPKDKLYIYLVDDGSTDGTYASMQKIAKETTHQVILIRHKNNKGKAGALNTALKQIKTKYFACLDADSEVDAQAMFESISLFEEKEHQGVAIVTPVMYIRNPRKMIEWMQKIEYATTMFLVRILSYIDCNYVAPGPFSMYKTELIREFGGFSNDTITEDQDIAYNAQHHHYKLIQSPTTKVYTRPTSTLKQLYIQRNRWFKGSLQCIRKYKDVIFNKEYGDFGLFQMPFNLFLFSLAIVSVFFFLYYALKPLYDGLIKLHQIGYDIKPYLVNMKFNFDVLALNWDSLIMSFLLISSALLILYVSHKEQQQSVRQYRFFTLIPYFFIYYLFLSFVATVSVYEFLRNKIQKW